MLCWPDSLHTWLRVAPSLYPAGSLVRYSCSSLAPGIKAYQQICGLTAPRLPQGAVSAAPVHRAQLLPTRSILHSFTTTVYINNNLTTTTSITQICAQHRARRSSALTPVAAGPSPYHLNFLVLRHSSFHSHSVTYTHHPSHSSLLAYLFFFFILNNDKP